MRFLPLFFLLFVLWSCCPHVSKAPTDETEIHYETELLIRASLTDRLVENTTSFYRDQFSAMMVEKGIPRSEALKIADAAVEKFREAEHQRLLNSLVPIYRRYYTAEEIHQLLSFYQTEVADKSLRVSQQIAAESQDYARLWSENFGEEILRQLEMKLDR